MRLGGVTVMLQMYPTVIIILCRAASGPRKVSDGTNVRNGSNSNLLFVVQWGLRETKPRYQKSNVRATSDNLSAVALRF